MSDQNTAPADDAGAAAELRYAFGTMGVIVLVCLILTLVA